jgi:hypothetical protein
MQPTASDTPRATERLAPMRASGHPSSPDIAAIPTVDPNPKSAM